MNHNYFVELKKKINFILIIPVISLVFLFRDRPINALIGLIVGLGIYFYLKKLNLNRADNLLKEDSPDSLIKIYEKMYGNRYMIPENQIPVENRILLSYSKAYIYALYGEFDQAQKSMSVIDWENQSVIHQALETKFKALLNYIKIKDYKEGLRLSIMANNLCMASSDSPEFYKIKDSFELYIKIGEILTISISKKELEAFEENLQKVKIFDSIVMAWALSIAYSNIGEADKAIQMKTFCKKNGPYCKPLIE